NSYDIGIQAYGSQGVVSRLTFDGNVTFNEGLPGGHRVANILVQQGGGVQQDMKIYNSVFYNPLNTTPGETGYNQILGPGLDMTIQNNWWIGGTPTGYYTPGLANYGTTTFTGNKVVGPLVANNLTTKNWSGNTYYKSAPPAGVDSGSPIINNNPTGQNVIV